MVEDSLLKYTRGLLIYDSVNTMFKAYLDAIHYDITEEEMEKLVERYLEIYKDYIMRSFEELDIQTITKGKENFIMVDELMIKVTKIVSAKLIAELLLVELRKEIK